MSTRRINETDRRGMPIDERYKRIHGECTDRDHSPPEELPPGLYEHECPLCGIVLTFEVLAIAKAAS